MTHGISNIGRTPAFSRRRALQLLGSSSLVIPAAALTQAQGTMARGSSVQRLLHAVFQGEPVQGGS